MARNTGAPRPSTMLRWTTLVVVAANVGFVADYSALGESQTVAEVLAEYGNMIVPVAFAKAIGAAVLVAFLLFYLDAVWPRRTRVRVYDKLVVPLAVTSVLVSIWIVAFRHKALGLSTALVAASFVLATVMFVRAAAASPSQYSAWLRVPFSLHFGAMTIALLVAATRFLNASGLAVQIAAVLPTDVATASLAIAGATGAFVALCYRDVVYPAVIASGAGAAFITQRAHSAHLSTVALAVCLGMLVVAVLAAVALVRQPRRNPKDVVSRRRAKVVHGARHEGWHPVDGRSTVVRF